MPGHTCSRDKSAALLIPLEISSRNVPGIGFSLSSACRWAWGPTSTTAPGRCLCHSCTEGRNSNFHSNSQKLIPARRSAAVLLPSIPREHPVLQFMLRRHFQSLGSRMKCKAFLITHYCYSLSFEVFCILTEQAEAALSDPAPCHRCLLRRWDPSCRGFGLCHSQAPTAFPHSDHWWHLTLCSLSPAG